MDIEVLFSHLDDENISMKDKNKYLILYIIDTFTTEKNIEDVNRKLEDGDYHVSLMKSSQIFTGCEFEKLTEYEKK